MENALIIGVLSMLIIFANRVQQGKMSAVPLRWVLLAFSLLVGLSLFSVIAEPNGWSVFVPALICLLLAIGLTLFNDWRVILRQALNEKAQYQPDSWVHTLALVLMLLVVSSTLITFSLGGGLAGMAETVQSDATTSTSTTLIVDFFFNAFMLSTFALVGVGLLTRRTLAEVAQRLGLQRLQLKDIWRGIGASFALYGMVFVASLIWQALVPPEVFEQQTLASGALGEIYSQSLLISFLMALSAGVGEEILFRGALQPIFGVGISTVFFVAIHTQYLFTPALLIILIVGLVFAYLRQKYGTNTAIVAHVAYNFLPFLLIYSLGLS